MIYIKTFTLMILIEISVILAVYMELGGWQSILLVVACSAMVRISKEAKK